MTRRQQADEMLLGAINNMEKDPNGQVSLLRSLVLATIANAMLMQESIDQIVELELPPPNDDDDNERNPKPW